MISRKLKDRLLPGDILLGYLIGYPLGRFFVEYLRPDAWIWGSLAAAQVFALVLAAGSATVVIVRHVAQDESPALPRRLSRIGRRLSCCRRRSVIEPVLIFEGRAGIMFNGAGFLVLQSIDREIAAGKRRFVEIDCTLKLSRIDFVRARQELESAERAVHVRHARQKDLELQIQGVAEEAVLLETHQMGRYQTLKELADLQAEIAALKRRRQSSEDDLLDAMISLEEAETEQNESQSDLQEKEQVWSTNQDHLRAEYETLTVRLERLSEKRERVISRLDQDVLSIYAELWKRKNGLPVAEAKAGACGVYALTLSSSTEWKLRQGELVQCNNCERILVRV